MTVADFNDEDKLGKGKEMQDRLSRLVAIFDSLDFSANRAEGDDLLGDEMEKELKKAAKAIECAKELASAYRNRLQLLCDSAVPKKVVARVTLSPELLSAAKN